MNHRKPRRMCLGAAILLAGVFAEAESPFDGAVPKSAELAALPKEIEFDCSRIASASNQYVYVFERAMRIPKYFEQDNVNKNAIVLRALAPVPAPLGDPSEFNFATLRYGEKRDFSTWTIIADDNSNWLGVSVRMRNTKIEKGVEVFEVALLKDQEYLQMVSVVPIQWRSLFDCFN